MTINEGGIASASKTELLAMWLYDNDLFRLFPYGEFVVRCAAQGVRVHG